MPSELADFARDRQVGSLEKSMEDRLMLATTLKWWDSWKTKSGTEEVQWTILDWNDLDNRNLSKKNDLTLRSRIQWDRPLSSNSTRPTTHNTPNHLSTSATMWRLDRAGVTTALPALQQWEVPVRPHLIWQHTLWPIRPWKYTSYRHPWTAMYRDLLGWSMKAAPRLRSTKCSNLSCSPRLWSDHGMSPPTFDTRLGWC